MKTDAINKIKTIWKNKWGILEGVYVYFFLKRRYKKIVKSRNNICKGCEHYDTKGTNCMVPGTQPCCGYCGCSLNFKQHSMSSACDLGKWHAVLTPEEEDELNQQLNLEL